MNGFIEEELGAYIVANVDGGSKWIMGTNLFASGFPDEPDEAVSIMVNYGEMPLLTMRGGTPSIERPRLQLLNRHPEFSSSRGTAYKLWEMCCSVVETTMGANRYSLVPVSSPQQLLQDARNRMVWSCNYEVWRTTV